MTSSGISFKMKANLPFLRRGATREGFSPPPLFRFLDAGAIAVSSSVKGPQFIERWLLGGAVESHQSHLQPRRTPLRELSKEMDFQETYNGLV